MELGKVVEFIDRQKIICAAVIEIRQNRLRLLTETNREVNLSEARLSHIGKMHLNMSQGRDYIVSALKQISSHRKELMTRIDIRELWEVLHTEQQWIDLMSMTEFCFPDHPADDHQSAVIRAFFENRTYFKFSFDSFFPYTPEQVYQIICREREAQRRNSLIEEGGAWLKKILTEKKPELPDDRIELVSILKDVYLFGKESSDYGLAQAILKRAGIDAEETIFHILIKLGVWNQNENIELLRFRTPVPFDDSVIEYAQQLIDCPQLQHFGDQRRDLTHLHLMTIDGASTLDFDDALSIEETSDGYRLGIHIADVGHLVKKDDILDQQALSRASSIYMPDLKIPMFPSCLAEGLFSLKAGKPKAAISVMIRFSKTIELLDYDIFASVITVRDQLTYYDVDLIADETPQMRILQKIASTFRQQRLARGAVQISLPDVNIGLDPDGKPSVSLADRESPGRMLVSEFMILANWLMANFLHNHSIPAVFRSQHEPKERLFSGGDGTLFQNWMQRKLMSRFILSSTAAPHSGLGLNAYVTSTSPIRKYVDLVTQRQLRSAIGLEEAPYSSEEIERIVQLLDQPMMMVSRLQYTRNRYWLLKYLESRIGQKTLAVVLNRRRNSYSVLLLDYLIECELPASGSGKLKPEDLVQVILQHVNARKDVISIYIG